MSALIPVLLAWCGLFVAISGTWRLLRGQNAWTACFGGLVGAGVGIALGRPEGFGMPVVWPVMSGYAWLSVLCAIGLARNAVAMGSGQRPKGSLIWLIAAIAFYALHVRLGDPTNWLRGSIPIAPETAVFLIICLLAGLVVAARLSVHAGTKQWPKMIAWNGALIVGSLVFCLPLFWLLLTSFKEERDMSNANGLVWIPRVTETRLARDPVHPLYATDYEGTPVQVEKIGVESGSTRVDVIRPGSLAGISFLVREDQLKEVSREMNVVETTVDGKPLRGLLVFQDTKGAHLLPMAGVGPETIVPPDSLHPVRDVGLRVKNYSDTLDAFPIEAQGGWVYLRNTLFLCIFSILGTIISCSLAAYGFARLRFPGRDVVFGILLSTMMLPGAVTMMPTFLVFRSLGWIDTLSPLWVPTFFGSAFNIFLLRQFFRTLPMELEDASVIDGCGRLGTLFRVMLPQIKPALVVVALWTFIGAWNNFMGPLIYISSPENMTVSYATQLFSGEKSGDPGMVAACATMALAPVILLFFFAQRYFVEGIALSGIAGR